MKTITLEWGGETLTISESEAFEIGERIEDIVTLSEIAQMGDQPKFFKLARCFAEMINFAGGSATPREVHKYMLDEIKEKGGDGEKVLAAAIGALIELLMDGAPEAEDGDGGKKT